MRAYYNEFDPFAAKWLSGLARGGKITQGVVDDRDFRDVRPGDLVGFERCHFFAGIGGWDLALQLAGWSGPVWTASLPCQPFSVAGRGLGEKDERHLFPDFAKLVAKCRPPIVFGEQVASKAGRSWLGGVRSEMEALGYSVGAADLCAAGVGAPHIRQRLFWVAVSDGYRSAAQFGNDGEMRGVSETERESRHGSVVSRGSSEIRGGLVDPNESNVKFREKTKRQTESPWKSASWVACADGKARRLEPGIAPLAHGVPGRVGLIRGYGNAIVPRVAAEFIRAAADAIRETIA